MEHPLTNTRFHLVRHASTDAIGNTLSGRSPTPLNTRGHAEAARLAHSFADVAVDAIISSPQLRAIQTAQAIGLVAGRKIRPDAALDEVDFGPWTGAAFTALAARPDWIFWNAHRSLAPAPGCETMLQVQARAAAVLGQLHEAHRGGTVVLVSHADLLKSVLAYALAMPIDLMQRLEISPASRSSLTLHQGGITVEQVNWTCQG